MIIKPTANILLKQDAGTDVNFDLSAVDGTDGSSGMPKGVEEQGALSTTAAALLTTPASGHTIQITNLHVTNTGASTRTITIYRPEDGSTVTAATTRDIIVLGPNCAFAWTPGGVVTYDANGRQDGTTIAATQSDQETGTSAATYVSPSVQHFHPSAAKFWAQVTGAGTPSLTTSYNVTSVADTGVGRMTVTIGNDFSSANWCCQVAVFTSNVTGDEGIPNINAKAAGTVEVGDRIITPAFADPNVGYDVVGYGDL